VTIRAEGTVVHELGSHGTWERKDPARHTYTITWRLGGFVDTVTLADGGQALSGINQVGIVVTATRIRDAAVPGSTAASTSPLPRLVADYGAEPQYQRGLALFEARDYLHALPVLQDAARRGHPKAEALLGRMCQEGLGVPVYDRQAASWFGRAAARGHRASQHALAAMFEEGEGVPKDVTKAAQLYEASARQGFDKAQFALGLSYEFGQGVARDRRKAIYWLMQAARQGAGRAHWIAEWLRSHDKPHLRDEIELNHYINARMAPQPRQPSDMERALGGFLHKQEVKRAISDAISRGDHEGARMLGNQNGIPYVPSPE
jgi:hypothetical protein